MTDEPLENAGGLPDGSEAKSERAIRLEEFRVRRLEAERALAEMRKPWWRQQDPLVFGIFAAFLTLIGNIAAPLWAAQIVQIDQALGRPIGFFNPCLYSKVGPAGVFRLIGQRVANSSQASSYKWSAVTGWGSPDSQALIEWLKLNGAKSCGIGSD